MAVSYESLRKQIYALMRQEGDPWTVHQVAVLLGIPDEIISSIMNDLADGGYLRRIRARTFRWREGAPSVLIKSRKTMVAVSAEDLGKLMASFADQYQYSDEAHASEVMELFAHHLEAHLDGVGNLHEAYRAARGR